MKIETLTKTEFSLVSDYKLLYPEAFKIMNAFPGLSKAIFFIPVGDVSIVTEISGHNGYVVDNHSHSITVLRRGGYNDIHKPNRPLQEIWLVTDCLGDNRESVPGMVIIHKEKESDETNQIAKLLCDKDIYFNMPR